MEMMWLYSSIKLLRLSRLLSFTRLLRSLRLWVLFGMLKWFDLLSLYPENIAYDNCMRLRGLQSFLIRSTKNFLNYKSFVSISWLEFRELHRLLQYYSEIAGNTRFVEFFSEKELSRLFIIKRLHISLDLSRFSDYRDFFQSDDDQDCSKLQRSKRSKKFTRLRIFATQVRW